MHRINPLLVSVETYLLDSQMFDPFPGLLSLPDVILTQEYYSYAHESYLTHVTFRNGKETIVRGSLNALLKP